MIFFMCDPPFPFTGPWGGNCNRCLYTGSAGYIISKKSVCFNVPHVELEGPHPLNIVKVHNFNVELLINIANAVLLRRCRFSWTTARFSAIISKNRPLAGRMNKHMDEQKNQQEVKRDFRKTNDATRVVFFRLLAIGVVLYWLFGIIKAYVQGGPEAPSLTMMLVAIVIMGGGAALIGYLTWKNWKLAKEASVMSEEEIAEMEALRSGDEE